MLIGLLLGCILLIVALLYLGFEGKENLNIVDDYNNIKEALKKYKQNNIIKNVEIADLKPYLKDSEAIDLERYFISNDNKYLVIKKPNKKERIKAVEELNIPYKIKNENLYLSFIKVISKIEPKAAIDMSPSEDILTTTTIKWSHEHSICEGGEIYSVEWRNMQERYEKPGSYEVNLRIEDKNGNWSEWESKPFKVKEVKGIKDIVIEADSIYVIQNNGGVQVAGDNANGQLGMDINSNTDDFIESEQLKNVYELAAGKDYALMLTYDKKIYGIGRNHLGQLGTGDQINTHVPIEIKGVPDPRHISTGKNFSAALTINGNVYVWGSNNYGQLGCDDLSNKLLPFKLDKVKNVKQVSLGYNHGLALCYDGSVIAWGNNAHGQLGIGLKNKCFEPTMTSGIQNVIYVCAGKEFSLAVTADGKIHGWGKNNLGQLAIESKSDVVFPTEIKGIKDIEYVSARDTFILALKKDGTVWHWGTCIYDEEEPSIITSPQKISNIKYIKKISAGDTKGLLLTTEDEVVLLNNTVLTK